MVFTEILNKKSRPKLPQHGNKRPWNFQNCFLIYIRSRFCFKREFLFCLQWSQRFQILMLRQFWPWFFTFIQIVFCPAMFLSYHCIAIQSHDNPICKYDTKIKLTINSASDRLGSSQDLFNNTSKIFWHRSWPHNSGRVQDIVHGDVTIVFDVFDLLPVPWRFFQGLDNQGCGRGNHIDLSLTILNGQSNSDLQAYK